MAGSVGRKTVIEKNDVVILGVRSLTMSWSGESIDVTSGEDLGKRLLLADSGQEAVDISGEGIMKAALFRELVLGSSSKMLTDIVIKFAILTPSNTTPAELSCNLKLSGYEEGHPYNDAITFSFTLESSGAWAYTPEAA